MCLVLLLDVFSQVLIIIIIIMEIDAAPTLSKYMTALGACNVKSFTYEINQHMREYTHTLTYTPHAHALTQAHTHKHIVRNSY